MDKPTEEQTFESLPKLIARRHWLLFFCGQATGVFTALMWKPYGLVSAAIALAVSAALYFFPRFLPHRQPLVWLSLFFAFGNLLVILHALSYQADPLHELALTYPYGALSFEGTVSDVNPLVKDKSYNSFILHVDTVIQNQERRSIKGKALVGWSEPTMPLFQGTRVQITGRLSPHLGTVNHGLSDMEDRQRGRGIFSSIRMRSQNLKIIKEPRFTPFYWASRLRQNQADRLSRVIPKEAFSFVLGVWLGDRSLISNETYETFAFSGTAHVLAVSGLHVGIIALSFPLLFRMLRISKRYSILGSMVGIVLFALMTGAQISVIRSTLMMLLYYLYQLLRREPDTVSVLSLSGVLFLTAEPQVITEVSFLLSFGSVSSLLLFYPGFYTLLHRLPRFLRSTLATTLAAQLITLPLVAWYFFNVSLTAIVANLLVVPLIAPLLWVSMATGLFSYLFSALALLTGHALLPLVFLIETINRVALWLPLSYVTTIRPTGLSLCFYGAALLFLYLFLYDQRQRRRNQIISLICVGATLLLWRPFFAPPVIDFLDVGRGDSTFIRSPGGTTLLIDAGDADSYVDAGKRMVLPFLRANRVSRLDYLVISHSDRDHIGGAFYLLQHLPVGAVVLAPEITAFDRLEHELCQLCEEKEIPVLRLSRGDSLPAEKATITVLHPPADFPESASCNDRSLVLSVEFSGLDCLFTGDIEEAGEKELLSVLKHPVDLLKVSHHGSPTSSTTAFLDQAQPAFAVASVQRAGSRGTLMTPAMVERYESRGIQLLRTDWHGGIRVIWNRRTGSFDVIGARAAKGYSLEPVKR